MTVKGRDSTHMTSVWKFIVDLLNFISCLRVFCFSMCVYHMHSVPSEARRGHWIPLVLELEMVLSQHMCAGN